MEDLKNAIEESLPSNATAESLPAVEGTDVKPESSPVAPVETPTLKVEPKEPPFNEHPRWKEVLGERDYWKKVAMETVDKLKTVPVAPAPAESDPFAGMTLEEKEAWQRIQSIARKEAEDVAKKYTAPLQQESIETKQTLAALAYERFHAAHPDVGKGSQEELQIAEKFKQGYTLEDAYTLVILPKKYREVNETVEKNKKIQQTQKVTAKVAANLETSGISSSSPMRPTQKVPTREKISKLVDDWMAGQSQ